MASSVERTLRKAKSHERSGQMAAALTCYQDILKSYPANARARKAIARLSQAPTASPRPQLATELSLVHRAYAQGRFAAALDGARALSTRDPGSEPAWTLLGASAVELGQLDTAKQAFETATQLAPASAQAHANLGAVQERLCDHVSAAESFTNALVLLPAHPPYLHSRAKAYLALGDIPAACHDLATCVEAAPDNIEAVISLAEGLCDLGQATQALPPLNRALSRHPQNASLLLCAGTTSLEAGDPAAAIDRLGQCLQQDPGSVRALNNLASAFYATGDFGRASEASQAALQLDPTHARAWHNHANAQQTLGRLDTAIDSYAKAAERDPSLQAATAQKLHFQAQLCDWSAQGEFDASADTLGLVGEPVSPFALLAFEDNPARHLQRARHYARQWAAPRHVFAPSRPKPRLKIGYVSGDLFDHATLFLLNGVLEQHDTTQFEIVVYGLNARRDSVQFDRLSANVAQVVDVHGASDAEIIHRIRGDALDIAVDLKGYTLGARPGLFAAGLAPVQISYLGYPGSMGMAAMDYIIADPHVIPASARPHYSEQVMYLPDCYQPNDDQREVSDAKLDRADHGLPQDAVVLCCFNQSYKICARVFDIWMRVMAQVPGSVLWLMAGNDAATDNLRRAAQAHGIAPDRLIFAQKLPQAQHLARHRLADLFVDTFAYNAHTTASDALYAGLPVVTRPGAQFASRVAASLLHAVGQPELIASDDAEYEALILRLASDPAALADAKHTLSSHLPTAPLFDTARYTRYLEAGYRAAWDIWHSGHAPRDIHVAPLDLRSVSCAPAGSSTRQGPQPAMSPAR